MNDYDPRNERGTLEADFDQLPGDQHGRQSVDGRVGAAAR